MTSKILACAMLSLALGGCQSSGGLPRAAAPSPCVDRTVQVYFEADSADLIPEGRAVLSQAAREARRCLVTAVEVVGLADAAGAPGANLELSKRRALAVGQALAASRLPAPQIALSAVGQAGAVTSEGDLRPVRRRADVILRLSPHPPR
jgi:outer membrane protein OmpA-like peptidoglycan-associated protein